MEEVIYEFDWNFIYGILIGALVAGIAVYFFLKRGSRPRQAKGEYSSKHGRIKTKKREGKPDVEWEGAEYADGEDGQEEPHTIGFKPPTAKFRNDSW